MMDPGSFLTRWWNTIKPLPEEASLRAPVTAQKRRQRLLIKRTIGVVALAAMGWGAYSYIASAPERANAQLQAGMQKMQPGTYREAVTRFDRAVSIAPELAEAYLERGIAHHFLGETEPALADLDKALDLNPDLAAAYNERGAIYRERGDTQKAIENLSKSIKAQATTDGYYQRGQAYESLGQHQKAIEDYDQAVAQRRDAPYVYRARAVVKDKLGDGEGAKQDRATADGIESVH
jgi:tetratricopeptide (TPR) repeat protein